MGNFEEELDPSLFEFDDVELDNFDEDFLDEDLEEEENNGNEEI